MTPEKGARNRTRSFVADVRGMCGWTDRHDPAELAARLKDDQVELLDQLVAETVAIAEAIQTARAEQAAV